MKYWEIIADNLSKGGWSWGGVSAIDSNGEQSGLQTHTAMTPSVTPVMKNADKNGPKEAMAG